MADEPPIAPTAFLRRSFVYRTLQRLGAEFAPINGAAVALHLYSKVFQWQFLVAAAEEKNDRFFEGAQSREGPLRCRRDAVVVIANASDRGHELDTVGRGVEGDDSFPSGGRSNAAGGGNGDGSGYVRNVMGATEGDFLEPDN